MKNYKRNFLIITLFLIIVGSVSLVYVNTNSRFELLQRATLGYQERAKNAGNNVDEIKITKPSNKDNVSLKSVDQMKGFVKDEDLSDGVTYEKKELMTYEEFLNEYTNFDYNPTISKDRMIWVVVAHHPNGYYMPEGYVDNARTITYYDAKTGDSIGFSVKSLNKNGMHISGPMNKK